jgi:nucleoside-diphosphate-sugar epimerase
VTRAARTVFVTGGTGAWGRATLRELRRRGDEFHVLALARPGKGSQRILREFAGWPQLEIVWGDLTDPVVIAASVARSDVVLHLGAVVSPFADDHPELARRVNIGAVRNLVAAVKALPDPSRVAVVGVGSVAESGPRNPPHHWGRIGDPVIASAYDEYGQSKIVAERELADAGLPRWTWLRQTGIIYPEMVRIRDPIMTHPPLGGVMEWTSDQDSARLAVGLAAADAPEEIWGGTWHVGSGADWQLMNWDFLSRIAVAFGIGDIRRWYDRDWFALQNFHGFWFTDSDRLEALVPFRADTIGAALARAGAELAPMTRWAAGAFSPLARSLVMRRLVERPRGMLGVLQGGDEARIAAYFGSREAWQEIGNWSTFEPPEPSRTPTFLDHGYDEARPASAWTRGDYVGAAAFRGGRLVSEDTAVGDATTPLDWTCADGHAFTASPRLVLGAGHWCPICVLDAHDYARQAERNAFLAQIVP